MFHVEPLRKNDVCIFFPNDVHGTTNLSKLTWNTRRRGTPVEHAEPTWNMTAHVEHPDFVEHEGTTWNTRVPRGTQRYHVEHKGTTWNTKVPRGTQRYHVEHEGATWNTKVPRGTRVFHKIACST